MSWPGAEVGLTLGEGRTPLLRSRSIGPLLRLPRLDFKLETANPTGGWLDRAAVAVVAGALRRECARVVIVGEPEYAVAVATYAARAGVGRFYLCPTPVDPSTLDRLARLGATVVEVAAAAERIERAARRAIRAPGTYLAGRRDPLRAEGIKTLALELAEQCGREAPNLVVVPGAAADDEAALARGFRQWWRAERGTPPPALVAVDPREVDARDARAAARLLAAEEGLLVGDDAAAVAAALIRIVRTKGFDREARIVLVLSGRPEASHAGAGSEPWLIVRTELRGIGAALESSRLGLALAGAAEAATLGEQGDRR